MIAMKLWICRLLVGLVVPSMAVAQTAEVLIAPYAVLGTIEQTRVDIDVGASNVRALSYAESVALEVPVGANVPIRVFASGSVGESLLEGEISVLDGERYLLLLSGDGERQPYQMQLVVDESGVNDGQAQALLVNAGFLSFRPGATGIQWLFDSVPEVPLLDSQYAQISPLIALPALSSNPTRSNLVIRRLVSGAAMVDTRTQEFDDERIILIFAGDPADGGLRLDTIGAQAVGMTLSALELGPVEVQLVHGASFVGSEPEPGDAFLSVDLGSVLRLSYADISTPILLPEQGSHRFGANSAANVDEGIFQTLELQGNRRYWIVAKSFSSEFASSQIIDPEPFVAIEVGGFTSPTLSVLSLHYVPSLLPGDRRLRAAVRSDVGETQAEVSAVAGLRNYRLQSGSSIEVDLKLSSLDGKRNYIDLAPVVIPSGQTVSAVIVGNGSTFPFRLVADGAGLTTEPLVDRAVSGLWATVDRPNQGLSLSPLPEEDRLVGSWFSYAQQGGEQRWFIVDSCNSPAGVSACATPATFDNTRAELTVYTTSGGSFGGATPELSVAGTMAIDFGGCEFAQVGYELTDFGSGEFQIANLTPSEDCAPSDTLN